MIIFKTRRTKTLAKNEKEILTSWLKSSYCICSFQLPSKLRIDDVTVRAVLQSIVQLHCKLVARLWSDVITQSRRWLIYVIKACQLFNTDNIYKVSTYKYNEISKRHSELKVFNISETAWLAWASFEEMTYVSSASFERLARWRHQDATSSLLRRWRLAR